MWKVTGRFFFEDIQSRVIRGLGLEERRPARLRDVVIQQRPSWGNNSTNRQEPVSIRLWFWASMQLVHFFVYLLRIKNLKFNHVETSLFWPASKHPAASAGIIESPHPSEWTKITGNWQAVCWPLVESTGWKKLPHPLFFWVPGKAERIRFTLTIYISKF